ncbi:MAG: hypothetical protein ACRDGA_14155, partial [Bacteroidota bacterium]
MDEKFPRELTASERELLLWVLPDDRPGYYDYRKLLGQWLVAAQGRRGEGNYILAPAGERIDNDSPLPQLFAYGVVETESGELSVCVRERLNNQLEYEILSLRGDVDPTKLREVRRWTFSTWLPRKPCPRCGKEVREVQMRTDEGRTLVLAVCDEDERLWVYDENSGINHPIPVTNFYNELM